MKIIITLKRTITRLLCHTSTNWHISWRLTPHLLHSSSHHATWEIDFVVVSFQRLAHSEYIFFWRHEGKWDHNDLWNHSQDEGRDRLWCKPITTACRGYDTVSYNKRTRLIVPFPVLQKKSRCIPQRRTWAASTKKKKAGGGAMFDPNGSVQSIIRVRHGAVWGTR